MVSAFTLPLLRISSTPLVPPAFRHHSRRRSLSCFTPFCRSSHQHLNKIRSDFCPDDGIRINKCLKSFASRRESDVFIQHGRVHINGKLAVQGARVFPGDVVQFDGQVIAWERLTVGVNMDAFIYVKLWKDINVVCTTNETVANNVIASIPQFVRGSDRVFPVGRLDENSTGLLLLTSDGRLPAAALGAGKKCVKEYIVTPDMYVTDQHLRELQQGVVISTDTRRDGKVKKTILAPTAPCEVERRGDGNQLVFKLQEGRNRQIRKMLGALGYTARAIHRVSMMGITLSGLKGPGDAMPLNRAEMLIIKHRLDALQV